jgi:hypothetical protein
MDSTTAIEGRPSVPNPPRTIGRALITYRDRRGWSDEDLAAFLRCDALGLARLAFIPCPNSDAADFAAQVTAATAVVGCAVEPLSIVLTNVDPALPPA